MDFLQARNGRAVFINIVIEHDCQYYFLAAVAIAPIPEPFRNSMVCRPYIAQDPRHGARGDIGPTPRGRTARIRGAIS
jgi:hypothetical protein